MKILFCDTSFEHAREALARHLPDDEILYCPQAAIADHIGQADVAIPLMASLDAERLARGERLRLIHQFGVGLEGVDVAAAKHRGIVVGRVPSQDTGNAVAVAEWTLFLMLALARHLPVQGESNRCPASRYSPGRHPVRAAGGTRGPGQSWPGDRAKAESARDGSFRGHQNPCRQARAFFRG